MLEEYFDYKNQCQQIRKKNGVLLAEFSTWLEQAGLAAATGSSHHANLDFYLNHFLLYADILRPADGVCHVGAFLGDWFIQKAM